jgi:hypothetical protein
MLQPRRVSRIGRRRMSQRRGWPGWRHRAAVICRLSTAAARMAAARSRIWAAAPLMAAARLSISAAGAAARMAAQARRMAEAAVVARDIINGAAMPPRDAPAARTGRNGIHRMRLLF